MCVALVTPPLIQLNTPYPAVPMLTGFLRSQGIPVVQRDFSLELSLKLFTPEFIELAVDSIPDNADGEAQYFRDAKADYIRTLPHAVRFLQGKSPETAWKIAARTYLPEGPAFYRQFQDNDSLQEYFGTMGTADQAKFLASLYMDDVASLFKYLDPDFGFGKYAESLAVSLPEFMPLLERLSKTTAIDRILDDLTRNLIASSNPQVLGLSVPFPGTLYGAFRIAATAKNINPSIRIVLGGGYVNSELRSLSEPRIFDFIDAISYDDGPQPLQAFINNNFTPSASKQPGCNARLLTRDRLMEFPSSLPNPRMLIPDYSDCNLNEYLSIVEMPNPMHRIWTDGPWLKLQLAKGCYWHKCAFCDLNLDYIGNYAPAKATEIADAMEQLIKQTGKSGFHFVDEAIPPPLIRSLSEEIIRRQLNVVWWGNIRFESGFTLELAQLMADSGCIAVTGGLECANDRLLTLMNKGITIASAKSAMSAFAESGILVHAYLMYAFPTETENEVWGALEFVRQCFASGILHSAYWHRFALTAHSPIAQSPDKFGISLVSQPPAHFAVNEIPFTEPAAPDWERIGRALRAAIYNFMLGQGLDKKPSFWQKNFQ